jgi:hypothetical protein
MTRTVTITWGMYLTTYGFGRTGRMDSDVVHLMSFEPYEGTALCGTGVYAANSFISGNLCPRCAKAAGIKTAADFQVDPDEQQFMEANTKANP